MILTFKDIFLKENNKKASIFIFLISVILGVMVSYISIEILLNYINTGEIKWSNRSVTVSGTKALISTILLLITGLLCLFFGIRELKKFRVDRIFVLILIAGILGLSIYFLS